MGLAQVFDHLLGVGMTRIIGFGNHVAALCCNIPALYEGNVRTRETERLGVDLGTANAL
jgi:hypothetical protein